MKTTKSSPFVFFVSFVAKFFASFVARFFVPSWLILVSFVRQKFTVRLNRANRGFSTVVGRSQLAPLEATS